MSKINGTRLVLMAAIPTALITLAVIGFNSRGIWKNDVALGRVDERVKGVESDISEIKVYLKEILRHLESSP